MTSAVRAEQSGDHTGGGEAEQRRAEGDPGDHLADDRGLAEPPDERADDP